MGKALDKRYQRMERAMTLPPYRMTRDQKENTNESVNHPKHYTSHPSGVECIQITEHMGFCIGNAIKYLWRASLKGKEIEDLRKARWYIDREIERLIKETK